MNQAGGQRLPALRSSSEAMGGLSVRLGALNTFRNQDMYQQARLYRPAYPRVCVCISFPRRVTPLLFDCSSGFYVWGCSKPLNPALPSAQLRVRNRLTAP